MRYEKIVDEIINLAKDTFLSFTEKVKKLENIVFKLNKIQLLDHLFQADVIPEKYSHDSTEEKIYAKYCDILFSRGLNELGLKSIVIEERSDAADVKAVGDNYSLVGDAKAFRLSRTAKNQKDFKVEALSQWRGSDNYAALLGPLYQYPASNSQIYSQATRYNVTLFSFTHLIFLIKNEIKPGGNIEKLWNVANTVPQGSDAKSYWEAVLKVVLNLTGKTKVDWDKAIEESQEYLDIQSRKEVLYWENEVEKIRKYDHKMAVEELIKALKIKNKIKTIEKFSLDKVLEESPIAR